MAELFYCVQGAKLYTLKKNSEIFFIILFQHSWKVHIISFKYFLHKNALILPNNKIVHSKAFFFIENTKIIYQLRFLKKNGFQQWKNPKRHKSKKKSPPKNGPRNIDPIYFIKKVWLISASWCFQQKSCSQTQLVVHKCTLIYVFVNAFRVL